MAMPLMHAPMQSIGAPHRETLSLPGKVQAVSIIQVVAGGLEILMSLFWFFYVLIVGLATFGIGLILIPLPIIVLTVGVLSLVSGSTLR